MPTVTPGEKLQGMKVRAHYNASLVICYIKQFYFPLDKLSCFCFGFWFLSTFVTRGGPVQIQATIQKNASLNNHRQHMCFKDIGCVLGPGAPGLGAVSQLLATMFINIRMC